MAFTNINQFATEFAIRTQLNYYNLLKQETADKSKLSEIDKDVSRLHGIMEERGYTNVDFCCGTQLINSVLGLLVFPEQQLFGKISKYYDREKWKRDFPVLSDYVFSEDQDCFYSDYYSKQNNRMLPESKSPLNILKHMRNAVSHKKITLYPVQNNGGDGMNQVTHIVFEDHLKTKDNLEEEHNYSFKLKISKDDFNGVMLEISNYFIHIDEIREHDARKNVKY